MKYSRDISKRIC